MELLQHIHTALQYKSKGVPRALKEFKDDQKLAPIFPIDWQSSASKTLDVTKFSNYAPALLGQASQGRTIKEANNACDGCKKGNGRFQTCVQARGEDNKLLFHGSCMNCIFGSSDRKCSLSNSKYLLSYFRNTTNLE